MKVKPLKATRNRSKTTVKRYLLQPEHGRNLAHLTYKNPYTLMPKLLYLHTNNRNIQRQITRYPSQPYSQHS